MSLKGSQAFEPRLSLRPSHHTRTPNLPCRQGPRPSNNECDPMVAVLQQRYLAFVTPEASRNDCHCTRGANVKFERKTTATEVLNGFDPISVTPSCESRMGRGRDSDTLESGQAKNQRQSHCTRDKEAVSLQAREVPAFHQQARETYTRQLAVEQVSGHELDKSSRGTGGEARS
jgi:hypothetical protein